MRGLVAGLPSPHPMGQRLPAVYQEEDPFTIRLTEALDEVLAPILSTLDNLSAYVDPRLAPDDFLDWLAGWVAFDLDEAWETTRRRLAVSQAVDLLRRRGTAAGLADEVRLVTGADVEVVENGGTSWSLDPLSPLVGSPVPTLLVRVTATDPAAIDVDTLHRIVEAAKPAHVPHQIEVVKTEPTRKSKKSAQTAESEASPDEPPTDANASS